VQRRSSDDPSINPFKAVRQFTARVAHHVYESPQLSCLCPDPFCSLFIRQVQGRMGRVAIGFSSAFDELGCVFEVHSTISHLQRLKARHCNKAVTDAPGGPSFRRSWLSFFQLLRKGGIRFTISHGLRSTTQVSGHDFSVLLEPSEAMRKQRSRAVQALKNILPCAAGRRAAQRSDLKSFRMPKLSIFMQRMHHV
jgi:hypothetical protein